MPRVTDGDSASRDSEVSSGRPRGRCRTGPGFQPELCEVEGREFGCRRGGCRAVREGAAGGGLVHAEQARKGRGTRGGSADGASRG